MITLSSIRKAYGLRTLFDDVTVQLLPGRRLALVGPNGAGKTTLLDIVAGEQEADGGDVQRAKDVVVGYLRQDVAEALGTAERSGHARSVVEAVMGAGTGAASMERRLRIMEEDIAACPPGPGQDELLDEYAKLTDRFEHAGGYSAEAEARRVLAGLGFAADAMDRDVRTFSGGWMMRVALARMLLADPDVLLLDEPTNHLDLDSVTWLQDFLADYSGAIVVVSHDRDFINAMANRVVELANGTATEYVGDYADFVEQRELRMEQARAAASNQQRKIAQTEAFIERFRYKASKARQVQSRIKALDRLDRVEVPEERRRALKLRFPAPPRSGRRVLRLDGVVKRYGDLTVYGSLDLVLERGQKIALVGPNGAGKSTLLKLIAGAIEPDSGERELGHNVKVAYYAQHQVESLDLSKSLLEEFRGVLGTNPKGVNPRTLLGAFLFSGDDVDKKVAMLSGGERARLALAKILVEPVNLLCMDEPTNHLDIASRDVLEDALSDYDGTVVLITHDRHLIRSVANTIIEVGGGTATVFPGDFEYYAAKTGLDVDGTRTKGAPAQPVPSPKPAPEAARGVRKSGERKRQEAERRNRVHRETKELRERLAKVEADLGTAESEVADLQRQLAAPDAYDDPEGVKDLVLRHNAAKDRAARLTSEWERCYEAVERISAS